MAWNDDNQEDIKKARKPVYSNDQKSAYEKMGKGATEMPPAFKKIKDFFSSGKKKEDDSKE